MKIIIPVIIASVIVAAGLTIVFTDDSFNGSTYEYIPSDITKANSNILVGEGYASMDTLNPADIKDRIVYTVIGKVLSVGDPIPWTSSTGNDRGSVPVTIRVDETIKGITDNETLTFYVDGDFHQGEYYIMPYSPQFEIGEMTLVHLSIEEDYGIKGDLLYVTLGKYGKYQIVEDKAYNEVNPTGKNLGSAKNESK